jgi:hypothetical protein
VNDSFNAGAGRILKDNAPFSVEYLNGALEELQDELRDYGAVTLIRDNYIMSPITPVVAQDPAVQINVSYTGFFDGTTQRSLPKLPADMIVPLDLWERETGSGNNFGLMYTPQGGLPSSWQCQYLGVWEWRGGQAGDAIWMVGATTSRDLRLRYQAQLLPISPSTTENPWTNIQVSVLASIEAMAHLVAYRYARARGPEAAAVMKADGEMALYSIKNRYVKESQGTRFERTPYNRDGGAWRVPGII